MPITLPDGTRHQPTINNETYSPCLGVNKIYQHRNTKLKLKQINLKKEKTREEINIVLV